MKPKPWVIVLDFMAIIAMALWLAFWAAGAFK